MSETPSNIIVAIEHQTPSVSQSSTTEDSGDKNKKNTEQIPIASKQINDIIEFQEPTTSKNYSFKTEIRINILGEPKLSKKSIDSDDSQISLSLFREDINDDNRKKKSVIDEEASFSTVDACIKEKMTNTAEPTVFSRNERTQRMIVVNSDAPPPYENYPPPEYSRSPYYTQTPRSYLQPVPDASRGGRYTDNFDVSFSGDFIYQDIRHQFIQKVFAILSMQLAITAGFVVLVTYNKKVNHFVRMNMPMFWAMFALELILYIVLMCYQHIRRIFPLNFALLALFTMAMGYICGAATVYYSTRIVLITLASTSLICFIVTLLAYQTLFDITKWSFIIAIASIVLMVFGLITMIVSLVTHSPVLWLVYSGLVTVLFSVFLLYDMQCILGGRRHEISAEEYIYAALTVYVDIVMIFMYMLHLVQACCS